MKVKLMAVVILWFSGTLLAAQSADPPAMPDKNRADILAIELRMSQEQSQYNSLKTQMDQLGESFQKDVAALQLAEADACKAANVNCEKDFSVDAQAVKFVKKQTPPPPAKK
ncbi:MAG: hypothetical protein WBA09_22225 [Candidatus Acidiferrum sp.]